MKKHIRENIRVEIIPKIYSYRKPTEEEQVRECENIIQQIKRHVDDVKEVYTAWDDKTICAFCGYEWEEDEETGEPVCCMKAVKYWDEVTKEGE